MDNDLQAIVNFYERDRGVNRELIIIAIENALAQVFGRAFHCPNHVRVQIDRKKLTLKAFRRYVASDAEIGAEYLPISKARIVRPDAMEGSEFEVEIPASSLGRIGIQNARQMILVKLREAERENVIHNYRGKIGEIITGTVRTVTRRGDVILNIENAEAVLSRRECLPTDAFGEGDTVRAVISDVLPLEEAVQQSMPPICLSRSSSAFLRQLFVMEVSEINDGTVEIMAVAREVRNLPDRASPRSKIAVRSVDSNIDPVGACVGVRGVRVRTIVNELGGEKIDIVRWSEDPVKFAEQALSPAKLLSITVDPKDNRKISVVVSEDQQSLAIGRGGQNVRLATKLVGCTINIEKQHKKKSVEPSFEVQLAELVKGLVTSGLDKEQAKILARAGYTSLEGILEESAESLAEATGLTVETAGEVIAKAATAIEPPQQ